MPLIRSRYSKRDAKIIENEQMKLEGVIGNPLTPVSLEDLEAAHKPLEGIMDVFADAIRDTNEGITWNIFTHMHSGLVEHGVKLDEAILALSDPSLALEGYVKKYVENWLKCEASWGALALVSSPEMLTIREGKNIHIVTGEMNLTTHTTDQSIVLERLAWRIWCCLQILKTPNHEIKTLLLENVDRANPRQDLPMQPEADEAPWETPTEQKPLLEIPERRTSDFRR